MKPQQVIDSLFDFSGIKYDEKRLERGGREAYIFDVIAQSSLRLGPLTEELSRYVRQRIKYVLQHNKPIKLAVTIGGFKNIHAKSSPHIDWAEVFQLDFLLRKLLVISQIYAPGIKIEYSGDTYALCFIDNLKEDWIKIYNEEFANLCSVVQRRLPSNVSIPINNIENIYDMKELEKRVDLMVSSTDWSNPAIKQLLKERIRRAENNFAFNGRLDYGTLKQSERQKLLEESVLKSKYYLDIDFTERSDYLLGLENIIFLHRTGFSDCYPITSVEGTDVQYWEGNGVLLKRKDDTLKPYIVSPKQYEKREVVGEFGIKGYKSIAPMLDSIKVIR